MADVRAMSRAGRENQILAAIYLRYERERVNGGTAYWIAKQIGMRPTSPRFREILAGMVVSGKLVKTEHQSGGSRWSGYWYGVPTEDVDRKENTKRRIEIRSKGVAVGQMELF